LQFRTVGYFNDRPKEIPNRLLTRWAASRRKHGALTLDDLIEISQLTDAQRDSERVAEGARLCFGLKEWGLGCNPALRPHWEFLADLSPKLRQAALSDQGLLFDRMPLVQQQRFVPLAYGDDAERLKPGLSDLLGASLHVEYAMPDAKQSAAD